jgi:CobQ-like glutamine amidotransferase family enzyme
MSKDALNIVWLYPDILHLHGDRGNLMALDHLGDKLGIELNISRVDSLNQKPQLEKADLLFACPGEVRNLPRVIAALAGEQAALADFIARGGYFFAIGNSAALLAKNTERLDGSSFNGLALLPMHCVEREKVYGDDIWFSLPDGSQLLGNQIQVLDTFLEPEAQPFAKIIYGRGNCGGEDEGCRSGNIIFTNALGPLLVKNPAFTASILLDISRRRGIEPARQLSPADTEYEDKSFALIRSFIEKKRA